MPQFSPRYFEDFKVGDCFTPPPWSLSEDEIITFAIKFDPQPIHDDPSFAKTGPYGGLIACGLHIISAAFRQFWDLGLFDGTSLGGTGVDDVRWLKPIRPNHPLTLNVTVEALRQSQSKPERGYMTLYFAIHDSMGDLACDCRFKPIIKTRLS